MPDTREPIKLGTIIRQYHAKVAMVGITGGERYYWLTDLADNSVTMVDAQTLEEMVDA